MRNFKYVRDRNKNASQNKNADQKKTAVEMGDIAPVMLENFNTLTGFKPSLDLIEGDPHNPPNMTGLPDDPERPSQGDVAGNSDYKNIDGPEKDKVQHEKEHVKQGKVAEAEEGSEDSGDDSGEEVQEESVEDRVAKMNQEFAEKYAKANTLYDIKASAGIDIGSSKDDFVVRYANTETLDTLNKLISENLAMADRVKQASANRPAMPNIPTNFGGGYSRGQKNSFGGDDLQMIIAAGEDYK